MRIDNHSYEWFKVGGKVAHTVKKAGHVIVGVKRVGGDLVHVVTLLAMGRWD